MEMASVALISPPHISSTSDSSSIISSPQSSPDHHNATSASSPADLHININCPEPVSFSTPRPQSFSKEQSLKSLKESIPYAMKLQRLQNLERNLQKEGSCHKKAARRLSKELYTILSWYALLQGALFAAVAQTSHFLCADRWGPIGIAVAVTLGTLFGVLDKLWQMGLEKQEVERSQVRQSAVYDKIALLYWKGSACDFNELDPGHNQIFHSDPGFISIFSVHGLLVLGFLLGFSSLIIISCTCMLCHPSHR